MRLGRDAAHEAGEILIADPQGVGDCAQLKLERRLHELVLGFEDLVLD